MDITHYLIPAGCALSLLALGAAFVRSIWTTDISDPPDLYCSRCDDCGRLKHIEWLDIDEHGHVTCAEGCDARRLTVRLETP